MATYLDFEEPLHELQEKINQTKEIGDNTEVDMADKINELQEKLNSKATEIFGGLTPWQTRTVCLVTRTDPILWSYIEAITDGNFQGIAWRSKRKG